MDVHIEALQETAHQRYMSQVDHVISLRLAGGSYKSIAEATGWTITKVRRVCYQELEFND